VSKTPIAEAVKAVATVRELQEAVDTQARVIAELVKRLERLEGRLDDVAARLP
jgi:hypothetical protein